MAVINTLAADVLALRGYDSEYHRISRFFRTRLEVENAIADGTWVPDAGVLNACIVGDQGLMIYDAADTVNGPLKGLDQVTRDYIDTVVGALIGDSPDELNTLTELAAAVNNNPNFFQHIDTRVTELEDSPEFNGNITAPVTGNIVPFYWDSVGALPDAANVHGAVAHAHDTGLLYYAHGGAWVSLAKKLDSDAAINTIGVPTGDANLGSFTGNIISDGATIKEALQSLESSQESANAALPTMIHASWDASSGAAFDFATNGIASSGVSAVTRQGEGIYRVEFTTPFATNAYTATCGVGSTDYSGANASPREVSIMTRTTDHIEVICERSDDAVNEDNFYMSVIIMG